MKTYHYVYKITNLLDGKIYVGKHTTQDLDDGYMGSGKLIIRSIKKYGEENFKKEILSFHESKEDALLTEQIIVDEDFVKRKDTYNLKLGGPSGSWYYLNTPEAKEKYREIRRKNGTKQARRLWTDPEFVKRNSAKIAQISRDVPKKPGYKNPFAGKKHTKESRKKIADSRKDGRFAGENASAFGKLWMSHIDQQKLCMVSRDDHNAIKELEKEGWIVGHKFAVRKPVNPPKIPKPKVLKRKSMYNPETEQHRYVDVTDENLTQELLDNKWIFGGPPGPNTGTIRMFNPKTKEKLRLVGPTKEEVEKLMSEGWLRGLSGKTADPNKPDGRKRKGIVPWNKGKKDESYDRIWMTNLELKKMKRISRDDIEAQAHLLDEGWVIGRLIGKRTKK